MSTSDSQLKKQLFPSFFLEVHFAICSLGLIGLVGMLSDLVVTSSLPVFPIVLNDYLKGFFFPRKTFDMAYFIAGSVALFGYWGLVCLVLRKWGEVLTSGFISVLGASRLRLRLMLLFDFLVSATLLLLYCVSSLINNKIVFLSSHKTIGTIASAVSHVFVEPAMIVLSVVWVIVCLLPLILFVLSHSWENRWARIVRIASFSLLGFVLVQAVHMFEPFVFERLKMINEYFDIPSVVYIKPESKKMFSRQESLEADAVLVAKAVNVTSFMNDRMLWWPLRKYNVNEKSEESSVADPTICASVSSNAVAREFVDLMHDRRNYDYHYDVPSGRLCLSSLAAQSDLDILKGLSLSPVDSAHVAGLHAATVRSTANYLRRQLAPDEKQFLLTHRFEMHWQILNRWVIHHHNFVLGPVNELALGRDISAINMQYGLLNAVLLGKLLGLAGGINYQSYFKVYYSFYYLYYALFILLAFYMFRRVEYVLAVSLASFAALNSIGFQFLFLGPGGNPMRHFPDLFVICGMMRYLCGGQVGWLFASLFFGLLAMLNNKEFGLFILLSLSGTLVVRMLTGESRRKFLECIVLGVAAIGAICIILLPLGHDALSKYYMAGLLGFRLEFIPAFALLLGFSASCFLIMHFLHLPGGFKYVVMLLIFYSQQLLVYYVWGGVVDHFSMYVPIYALTAAALFKLCADSSPRLKVKENSILVMAIAAMLCVYIPCMAKYYMSKKEYAMVFETHKTYEWTMPRAKFISTMNPSYFEQSVALMRRYEQGKGIYMLSKYDAFLPFLAEKYQAMPFPEVSQFLATSKEMRKCIDTVKKDRPQFLFVDSAMERDLGRDIIRADMPVWGYLNEESRWRIERLSLLQKIWREVSSSYEKIDSGGLIDVYRLKTDSAPASYGIK